MSPTCSSQTIGLQRFVKVLVRVNLIGVNGILTSTQVRPTTCQRVRLCLQTDSFKSHACSAQQQLSQAKFIFAHSTGRFSDESRRVSGDAADAPRMNFNQFCNALESIEFYTDKSLPWLVAVVVSGSHRPWDDLDSHVRTTTFAAVAVRSSAG